MNLNLCGSATPRQNKFVCKYRAVRNPCGDDLAWANVGFGFVGCVAKRGESQAVEFGPIAVAKDAGGRRLGTDAD